MFWETKNDRMIKELQKEFEILKIKMAGLEAILDRLEREGRNERSDLDRMLR